MEEQYGTVLVHVDQERLVEIEILLDRVTEENRQLRRELNAMWMFLCERFEGRFSPSPN
jgi:hypothetical protein